MLLEPHGYMAERYGIVCRVYRDTVSCFAGIIRVTILSIEGDTLLKHVIYTVAVHVITNHDLLWTHVRQRMVEDAGYLAW